MKLRTIKDIKSLKGKRVLVRVDFNVPLKNKKILDDTRIIRVLPTIKYLIKEGARIVLISHLNRPKGKLSKSNSKFKIYRDIDYSLRPIAKHLESLLGRKIIFISECVGKKVEEKNKKIKNGDIMLLENIRFYKEEDNNNKNFAKSLAKLGDLYINEAFSFSHRLNASMLGITNYIPSYAGFLLEKEINALALVINKPKKPYVILLGGAKLSTKIKLIKKLIGKANKILIGGAMANVFLKSKGYKIGKSLSEEGMLEEVKKIIGVGERLNKSENFFLLPVDVLVVKKIKKDVKPIVRKIEEVQEDDIILDIGPNTISRYAQEFKKAKTILWNGPMGKIEYKQFSSGSLILARFMASISSRSAYGVCGGGETIEVLRRTKMAEFIDWVSTGGGAMLVYLSGEKMPVLDNLKKDKINKI